MGKLKCLPTLGFSAAFLLINLVTSGCKKDQNPAAADVTDYSKPGHWLTVTENPQKSVDVFYLYPTTYQKGDGDSTYCTIDNASMHKGAPIAFGTQATAFETVGNIFAPYYRQSALPKGVTLTEEYMWKIADSIPYRDVSAAFDYYIKNYNNGRPFILAGHSQGAIMLRLLLSQYMKQNPEVYSRMVAAYVIGYPVTAGYLSENEHLKFAEGPDDTGVIISYNTQSPDMPMGGNIIMGTNIGIVINPISWRRDETPAQASESMGSFMPGSDGVYGKVQAYADARIDLSKGVVICTTVDEDKLSNPVFGHGGYHMWDYPFYYYNLRENAARRVSRYFEKQPAGTVDYSKPEHWLSSPASPDKPADIFYLYPTAWTPDSVTNPLYCEIDNPGMLKGAAYAFSMQATAFETAGNVYAPFYRQANAKRTLTLPENQRWDVLKQLPAKDITAAFDYYITHFNNGRPFILAGHSQGANLLMFLLSDYMVSHPQVYSRMIAAYVIGYPVTADFLGANKHLKFAAGADDTGVIISYNTQSPKVVPGTNIVVGNNIGLVINPISWKRDETPAPASESLGTLWFGDNQSIVKVMNFADARIDEPHGVLICSSVNDSTLFAMSGGMGLGVYHGFDIPFYYYNLRQNAENRVNRYLHQ